MTEADLTKAQLEQVIDLALGFYGTEDRIDWDDFLYRVETTLDIDLPNTVDHPEIRRIRRAVTKAREGAR